MAGEISSGVNPLHRQLLAHQRLVTPAPGHLKASSGLWEHLNTNGYTHLHAHMHRYSHKFIFND